ncbi:MAG: hypothetical protein RLY30_363, partial [Pseudomonadota bacterium]
MGRHSLSTDDVIALMSGASSRLFAAESPAELVEVLGSAIQQAHLAQSVTLAGPFSGHGMSRLADAGHSSPS